MSNDFKNWLPVEGTNEEWLHNTRKDGSVLLWKRSWGGKPNRRHLHLAKNDAEKFFAAYKEVREYYQRHFGKFDKDVHEVFQKFATKLNEAFDEPNITEDVLKARFKPDFEKKYDELIDRELKKAREELTEKTKNDLTKGNKSLEKMVEDAIKDPEVQKALQKQLDEYRRYLEGKRAEYIAEKLDKVVEVYDDWVSQG